MLNNQKAKLDKQTVVKLVGSRVREIRLENKQTIEALAFSSDMEYTQLSRIELGKINTSLFQIYKISRSLNISVAEIMHVLP